MNDNPFDPKLYGDAAISAETRALNASLVDIMTPLPNWWDIGAEVTREARRKGGGPFPLAPTSDRATTRTIDGPGGHKIPLRIIAVSAAPGETALTVMSSFASERARPRVIETTPPFVAA